MRRAVVVGIGEMGGVFARGLLRTGIAVVPVLRNSDRTALAAEVPDPELALVTVAEDDLDGALESLPRQWRDRVGLIQNELLPTDWVRHGIVSPTVAVVWFEKKPGRDVAVIRPTPVAGPAAGLVVTALQSIGVAAEVAAAGDLLHHLVVKNLYILTANIAGLRTRGTVGELWAEHGDLARAVASEVLDVQEHLAGVTLDRERLMADVADAFAADPTHGATGRSAPRRLRRLLDHAAAAGIPTPAAAAIGQAEGLGA